MGKDGETKQPGWMVAVKAAVVILCTLITAVSVVFTLDTLPLAQQAGLIQKTASVNVARIQYQNQSYSSLKAMKYVGKLSKVDYSFLFKLKYISYQFGSVNYAVYFYSEKDYALLQKKYLQADKYVTYCNKTAGTCFCAPNTLFKLDEEVCWIKNVFYGGRDKEMSGNYYLVVIGLLVDAFCVAAAAMVLLLVKPKEAVGEVIATQSQGLKSAQSYM